MSHSLAFRVDALPADVFELLASFLIGFELLHLSHVNSRLLTELLGRDAPEWKLRARCDVNDNSDTKSAKERYSLHRSVRFPGDMATKMSGRGGAVDLWTYGPPCCWREGSFSFDCGGIVFGAQSTPWSQPVSPHYKRQFVHIDTQGGLYCSVIDAKPLVTKELQPERWYHLALTFDKGSGGDSTQRVYPNRDIVYETRGRFYSETYRMYFPQLGSGYIGGSWCSFNGVLDSFRVWRGALEPELLRQMAHGEQFNERLEDVSELVWSMATAADDHHRNVRRVRYTRPTERVFTELKQVPQPLKAPRGYGGHHAPTVRAGRRAATVSSTFGRKSR